MVVAADLGMRLPRRAARYGAVKLLVTGRNGQIARSLEEQAKSFPHLSLVFAARPEVDLARPNSLAKAIEQAEPDIVINAAAYTDVDQAEHERELAFRVNAGAAGEAAEAAARLDIPIIQLSTDYVFDGRASEPYGETASTNPINVYGASKLEGEQLVRTAHADHLILRTSWVVSPFGRNFVKTMLRLATERDEISVVDDQFGSPTGAHCLADAILRVAELWCSGDRDGVGETLHLAGKGICSWAGLARRVMEASAAAGGPKAHIRPITTADYPTAAQRPAFSALNSARFHEMFGFGLPVWQEQVEGLLGRLLDDRKAA